MDASPTYDREQVLRAGHAMANFGGDTRLIVWFFDKPILNGIKSKESNRPIYENVTHVHIQQPGERDYFEQPAQEDHTHRFPRQWDAFKNNRQAKIEGTPLSVLFPTDAGLVESMKHINVHTVEHLANLNDTAISNIGMGGREFVQKAKEFLAFHDKGKGFNELTGRLDAMALKEKEKDARIAALEKELARTSDPDRPRRGRPPNPPKAPETAAA